MNAPAIHSTPKTSLHGIAPASDSIQRVCDLDSNQDILIVQDRFERGSRRSRTGSKMRQGHRGCAAHVGQVRSQSVCQSGNYLVGVYCDAAESPSRAPHRIGQLVHTRDEYPDSVPSVGTHVSNGLCREISPEHWGVLVRYYLQQLRNSRLPDATQRYGCLCGVRAIQSAQQLRNTGRCIRAKDIKSALCLRIPVVVVHKLVQPRRAQPRPSFEHSLQPKMPCGRLVIEASQKVWDCIRPDVLHRTLSLVPIILGDGSSARSPQPRTQRPPLIPRLRPIIANESENHHPHHDQRTNQNAPPPFHAPIMSPPSKSATTQTNREGSACH